MDLFFITITVVFIFFLVISYYLDIIKLSAPLILIYFVFCFTQLIKQDIENEKNHISSKNNNKKNIDVFKPTIESSKKNKEEEISNPVVSFNPKPIVIDSNLVIQKDLDSVNPAKVVFNVDKTIILKENNEEEPNTLKLKEIMICRGVYKRNPVKPGFNFTNNVDSLYCYTKISNSGSKQEIKHVWYFKDKLVTSVVYNIKTSYNYRSWSKKTISPNQIGKWRVDIIDSKDDVLGSREFEISSLNDLY